MHAFYVTIALVAATVVLFAIAKLVDRYDAGSLHRLHRRERRRMTVMKLPNERAQIVGDGAWVVKQ